MPETNKKIDTFEIALTMAGAVSGGAYTAGFLDYLVEALDTWHAQKDAEKNLPPEQRTVPSHKVVVCGASGASAGSMCTAILGVAINAKFPHVRWDGSSNQNAISGTGNPFFESWVKKISIEKLLSIGDKAISPLPSLLNSKPIDQILFDVLSFTAPAANRTWVANPFVTRFGLTNLRGVSYHVSMRGNTAAGHQMRVHADHLDFKLPVPTGNSWSPKLPELGDATVLSTKSSTTDKLWQTYGESALASGAFPFALKPRRLERLAKDYDQRQWVEAVGPATNAYVKPDPLTDHYGFYCMDSGLTDNEPLELARQILTGSPWDTNPREGDKANRAVVMIDPFVEDASVPADEAGRSETGSAVKLQELFMPLFDAWKMQCRFKPAELALAHCDEIYSRFLVAPSRGDIKPTTHPLAAGGLGAFLGFCHESFRIHDYLLGRRNCQQFLLQHFSLPATNSIIKAGYCDSSGVLLPQFAKHQTTSGEWPIIPLIGDLAKQEEQLPKWPKGIFKPEKLSELLKVRIAMVLDVLSKEATDSMGGLKRFLVRTALSVALYFAKPKILEAVLAAMNRAMKDQNLD